MPIAAEQFFAKESTAKNRLEFYGFWLWNYTYADYDFYRTIMYDEELEKNEYEPDFSSCFFCDQRREYCVYCHKFAIARLDLAKKSVFEPWSNDIFRAPNHVYSIRFSSDEMLMDAYYVCSEKLKINMEKAYKLQKYSDGLKVINIREEKYSGIEYSHMLPPKKIASIEIDLSVPVEVIYQCILEMHQVSWEYYKYTGDEKDSMFTHSSMYPFYQNKLRLLLAFGKIAFSLSGHPARALGFWLWEQVERLKKFPSVGKAIHHLEKGEEFPAGLLQTLGFPDSDLTVFNRLLRQTKRCIQQREVLTIG